MKILVTGGAGYIGSHIVVELLNNGHDVVIVDNFNNSQKVTLDSIEKISSKKSKFYEIDIRNEKKLRDVFESENIDACIHCAGLKAVGESVVKPLEYYDNNINGTISLLKVMNEFNCKNLIFSSSATVYGAPKSIPITEECPKGNCTNPYGQTKSMIEQILTDLYNSNNDWNIIILRYFNPIGAHKSGLIGESPNGIPNNLMPYITQVASNLRPCLSVFGSDYDTHDGTGVRDYIHVLDLADGHVKALKCIEDKLGFKIYNLGTGNGYSVLDVIKAFKKVNNIDVSYKFAPRRDGDIAVCYADSTKAEKKLNWKAKYSLEDMCRDAWNWQQNKCNN